MKKLLFAGLAAALCLVGCNKEADVKGLDGRPVEIILSDAATRTVNSGMSTKWENGDALNVFVAPAGSAEYSANAKFEVDDAANNHAKGTAELTADAYDWYLLYPYSSYIKTPANTGSGYIPVGSKSNEKQTQAGLNSMAHLSGENLPVYGVAKNVARDETPVVSMKHVASVVAINLTNATSTALKVDEVSFTASQDIVGTYYIDFSQETLAFKGSGNNYVSNTASLTVSGDETIAAGASAKFYLAIKPFTAKGQDKLVVKVHSGELVFEKEVTLPTAVEFKSGVIKQLNVTYTGGSETQSSTLAEIIASDNNTDVQTNEVLVVAKYARGIMLAENGSYLLAFNSDGVTGEVGDIVTVSGKVGEYSGLKQITSPEVTVVSSGNEVVLPEPKVLETLDEYASDKVELIQYTGTLAVSGNYFNVNVTGSTRLGSIQYPIDTDALKALDKKVVTATGFFTGIIGSSTKYVNMMSTSVEEATVALFGVESEEINVPATATSADIKVTGNVDWTVTPGDGILSVEPLSGTGAGTVKVTFAANTTAEPKEYSVTIGTTADVEDDEKFVTIIQAAASTEAKTYPYTEAFDNGQGDFSINDVNKPADLTYVWTADTKNHYMKASAYKNPTNYASESWLISPVIDLKDATAPVLSFTHATNFFSSVDKAKEEATVWAREEGGSWTALEGVNYPASLSWTFVESGSIDLSAYKGKKIQIAFKYTSTATKAGTWEIKDFELDEAVTGPVDPTFTAPETLSVEVGKTAKINVTTNSDGAVTFATSDAAVATVAEDGTVTGVAAGTANVTVSAAATANFNAASATVAVTVTEAPGADDIVFDFSSMGLTNGTAYTTPFTESGVSVQFTGGGNNGKYYNTGTGIRTYSGAIAVSSESKYIEKIVYTFNNASTTSGDVEYFCYPVEGEWSINVGSFTADVVSTWTGEAKNVVLTRTPAVGHWRLQKVVVTLGEEAPAAVLSSISVEGQKTAFNVGDTFSHEGAVVTALYNDGTTKTVTDGAVFSTPDMTTAGTKTVTVAYTEADKTVSTTYSITVAEQPAGDSLTFVFDEKSAETGTDQWPAAAASSPSTQTYTLNGNDYTFALGKDTYMGAYSGKSYLMIKSGSYLGLPAIAGKKLVKVQYTTSSGASTGTYGAICTDTSGASPVSGGESIALNQLSTEFSWTLSGTEANTMYYFVASKKNSQTVKIVLTYE